MHPPPPPPPANLLLLCKLSPCFPPLHFHQAVNASSWLRGSIGEQLRPLLIKAVHDIIAIVMLLTLACNFGPSYTADTLKEYHLFNNVMDHVSI